MSMKPTPRNSVTISEACATYGIAERTMRRYIAEGRVPAWRLGPRLIRIDPRAVEALFERVPTTDPAA